MYTIKKEGTQPVENISITEYCNVGNDYRPKVIFNLTYNDEGFHAHFDVYEKNPYAKRTTNFSDVCCDRCVEWFMYFAPDICDRYFNFEVNANGAMDVSFRKDRYEYVDVTNEEIETFNIITEIKEDKWTVDYTISYDFIKKYIKDYEFKTGVSVKANVYKCGEETEFEHYGCWSMVDREKPDFHKPEFFGTMNIQ